MPCWRCTACWATRWNDVASTKSADLVESSISSPSRRKLILHNSYHIITLDNEKELVADETIAFFNQHLPSEDALLNRA